MSYVSIHTIERWIIWRVISRWKFYPWELHWQHSDSWHQLHYPRNHLQKCYKVSWVSIIKLIHQDVPEPNLRILFLRFEHSHESSLDRQFHQDVHPKRPRLLQFIGKVKCQLLELGLQRHQQIIHKAYWKQPSSGKQDHSIIREQNWVLSISPYLVLTKLSSPSMAMVLTKGYYASS